jgi:predicted permease
VVAVSLKNPLPFEDPDRLLLLQEVTPQGADFSVSEPNYLDWVERQRAFSGLAGFSFGDQTLSGDGPPEQLSGTRITHGFLDVTGLSTLLGRGFLPREDQPGGPRVVLLAQGFWERRFGSDPTILGSTLRLDGDPHEIVGVVSSDEAWPDTEIFTPLAPDPGTARDNHLMNVLGRLRPEVTVAEARADLQRVTAELAEEYPEANAGWSGTVITTDEWRIGDRTTRLGWFLMGAVALLLLMACGSVSNLLLARATTRQKEMGLRAALGAGRHRILGQLVTESALLAFLGGGLGVLLAWWATPLVRGLGPADVARLSQADVNGTVLLVAAAVSAVSVLVFGLVPALHAARGRLSQALREGGPTGTSSGNRIRSGLMVGQFALAIVLLLGAGLLLRSFSQLQSVELGFDADRILRFSLNLPESRFSDEERVAFVYLLQERMEAIPGVEHVGVTMSSPYGDFRASNFVAPADNVPDSQDDFVPVSWRSATGALFQATGVPLLAGRTFDASDRPGADGPPAELPVIIDETLAQRLWPDQPAVGKVGVWEQPGGFPFRVVGVVGSVRDEYVDARPRPRIYLPYAYFPWAQPAVLVRAASEPAALVPAVRAEMNALDPDLPLIGIGPLEDTLRDVVAWPRFSMQVVGAFALVALILSGMGIYGVTAFGVNRRRKEIGVRVALGADSSRVVGLVLGRALRLAAVGIVLGLLLAWMSASFLESLLFEVTATDPVTWIVVPLFLAGMALGASWMPARRATRVDPREALTEE